jgi:hypothetical protein
MIGIGLNIGNRVMGGGGGGSAFDVDAQAFFDRVTTAGGTLTTTEKNATNQLVLDMKANGTWTSMLAVYPMVGASAAACAQNLKSSSFTGTFSSGWTFSSTGATPNGSSAYMNSGLNASTNLSTTSLSFGGYTSSTENKQGDAYHGASPPAYLMHSWKSYNFTEFFRPVGGPIAVSGGIVGMVQANQVGSDSRIYTNGTLGASGTITIASLPNQNMYIGATNSNGTATFFDNHLISYYYYADGLTPTQALNHYTAVQTFNQTLNRQVGAQIVSDADAQAYIDRVYTAGGTLTNTEANAVNQLTIDMKAAGIWTAMKAVYPMVGSSAAACAQNLKSSSFTGTFTSGWTFASTGVTPNGTSAYMDSNLNPNTVGISASSMHISNYLRTNSNGVFCDMGGYSGNPSDYQVSLYSRLTDICYNDLGAQSQTRQTYSNTDSIGYYINTRTANNVFKMFKSNTLKATNTATNTSTILSTNIFLGANNQAGATQFSPRQNAFASIGDGLTDTQAADFYTCVQTFQTTLGRQVAG